MKKKILFVFKYNALNDIIKPDGKIVGPADFLFGMNLFNQDKYETSYINAPQGNDKNLTEKFLFIFEKIFSKITKLSLALEIYPKFKKQIKTADVLFCANDSIGLGVLFWKRLGFIKTDVIVMVQAIPERIKHFRHVWPVRWFISWLLQKALIILTFTSLVQADFIADFKLDKDKLRTFPFGVDTDFWKNMPETKKEGFIISIGNDGNRDYQTLVEALPEDVKLKIVTKRTVDTKNKAVEILSGLSNEIVRELYNQASFAVIPSIKLKNESPGQSTAMQLMACGTAVIIPRLPTMEEIFTDKEDCLFYEPENISDLREKIKTLLEDKTLKDKIVIGGQKKVLENFTCQKMTERLEKNIS